jgi:hypothetical protein
MKYSLCIIIILVISGTTLATERRIVPMIDVDPQTLDPDNAVTAILPAKDESRGWTFGLTFETRLEFLAWNDTDGDGLSHSHRVGIWRNTLTDTPGVSAYWPQIGVVELVAETVIPAGVAAELSGAWRRVPVGSIPLAPGQYYIVGENHVASTDDYVLSNGRAPTQNRVTEGMAIGALSIGQPTFGPVIEGGWLVFTGTHASAGLAGMGPMLFVREIPEPASSLHMLLAGCAIFSRRVGARRKVAQASDERFGGGEQYQPNLCRPCRA